MPASHLEVERSFDLADDAELPDLGSASGVARAADGGVRRLVATYYDTSDHRLLAAGASLRRRAGGDDAGWHLKLPADGGRLEVHASDTGEEGVIPKELLALSRSLVRRRPLEPVATLATNRRLTVLSGPGDTVLAEVADDEVAATVPRPGGTGSLTWREVEVELVGGDATVMAAVGELLLASGARPARHQSKVARALDLRRTGPVDGAGSQAGDTAGQTVMSYCGTQVSRIVRLDPLVRMDAPDAVHQMRVAMRRLRSALATFRPVLDRVATDRLRDELRWLAGVLGPARDLEVLGERLTSRLAALDVAMVRGPVAARLSNELARRRGAVLATALHAMDSDRYLDLLESLEVFVTDPPLRGAARRSAQRVLLPRLRREVDRVVTAAEAAATAEGPARDLALHEVRKAAKRARYAAEAVSSARTSLGGRARRVVRDLKGLQELLGDRQDSVVARRFLDELAGRVHAERGDGFTYGLLLGMELAGSSAPAAAPDVTLRARRAARRVPS